MFRSTIQTLKRLTFLGTRAPIATDDLTKGAVVGQSWIDTSVSPYNYYVCTANAAGNAQWALLSGGVASVQIPVTYDEYKSHTGVTVYSLPIFSLPVGSKLLAADIFQPAAMAHYAGAGITAATMQIGITGTLADFCAANTVFTAGANVAVGAGAGLNTYPSTTAVTPVLATLTTTGANISLLSAGECLINLTFTKPTIAPIV